MQLFFKTLDHKTFHMEVDMEVTVEDIICKFEDDLGRDNLYKLIYAGKLLKEEKPLSDYNIHSKIPIILMVTKPVNTGGSSKVETGNVLRPQQMSGNGEKAGYSDFADFKRIRTVTEDSGFDDDFNTNHFVTDTEFKHVLEIVQTCEYLCKKGEPAVTISEIKTRVSKFCEEEDIDDMNFEDIILEKIDDIIEAKLNIHQLYAVLEDVQSIFEESRESIAKGKEFSSSFVDEEFSTDESDTEEDTNLSRLRDMGFSEEEAENALNTISNNLKKAVEFLVPATENEKSTPLQSFSTSSKSNPLVFLRDIGEFQFLRYLVLRDPSQLQPLLLSFGQSHPEVMQIINQNKDIFVSMIHEQTGAKLHGRH